MSTAHLDRKGPLEGLRVVDCSRGTAGLRATGTLADYGADVIWVEPPAGDPYRTRLAAEYSVYNRGKRSAVLDLHTDEGRQQALDLIASADVFVQSWRPGVADRLGLGYDALHEHQPSLVYCSISGFGPDGPHRDLPGYESLVHAVLGTMGEQVGHREGPIYEGLPFAGVGTAYLALIGILAALYRQGEDGIGRHVETSMLDGALAFLSMVWGEVEGDTGRMATGASRLIARTYLCGGDQYIGVHTGAVGAFGRLMKTLRLDDRIPSRPDGLDMGVPLTPEQKHILDGEIHDIFASQPREVWHEKLTEADVCAIPVLHPGEVFDAPQVRHNEMTVEIDDPVLGPVDQVAAPVRFSTSGRVVTPSPAPRPGQHTAEVLAESATPRPNRFAGGHRSTVSGEERPLLDGLRILDLGAFYAGPYASRLLADLGAEVIKLEPLAGDPLRGIGRVFRACQAGKRSIAANVKDPALAPAVRHLAEWADVVHHNMRPDAAERLGIGYEQVRALNPGAVYVYAPGWGSTGPYSQRQSFAPLMSGYVGAGFEVGGQYNPPMWPVGNEDPGNGLVGAVGILMALLERQRTGAGQLVEAPQINAAMNLMAHVVRRADGEVLGADRLDPLQTGVSALDRLYQTADGWLHLVAPDEDVDCLAQVIGVDLLADPRFATNESRAEHDYELAQLLGSIFEGSSAEKWVAELRSAGVVAVEPAPYNNVNFMRDPENHRNGRVAEAPGPDGRAVREVALLLRVSHTATAPHRLAPGLGEHTSEVLSWAGYDQATIDDLRTRGVVA